MNICIAHGGDLSEPSGGTARVTALAGALATDPANEVTVVAPEPRGALPGRLEPVSFVPVGVGTRHTLNQPLRALAVVRRARTLARERDARLQIEHSTMAGIATLVGCSGYVLDMHDLAFRSPQYGDLPLGRLIQVALRRLEGRGVRAAEEVVVVSEAMAEFLVGEIGHPRDRLTVIPNGYDPGTVAPYRDTEAVEGRVAFLGTLHRKLDVDAFRAIARLDAVSDFVVIGDDGYRDELERMSRSEPAMRVTGRLPDEEAFPLVAGAQVVVNPQQASALQAASSPVKLFYYAALGCAMVLTAGPETADRLAAAGAARLVEPGGDVAGAVDALLQDPGERRRMGARAADAVAEDTWDRRGAALADVYGR